MILITAIAYKQIFAANLTTKRFASKPYASQYENVKEAVKNMGLDIEVEYITDMQKVMEYGVMSMPAIVANEKVVSMGKLLKASEVEKLFRKL